MFGSGLACSLTELFICSSLYLLPKAYDNSAFDGVLSVPLFRIKNLDNAC